jgi:hypothetical protein
VQGFHLSKKIENLVLEQKAFILYLYNFSSGNEQEMQFHEFHDYPGYEFGNTRRSRLSDRLHKFIPFVFLFNPKEKNDNYKGYALVVSDHQWFSSFKILYNHAKYAVIDYTNRFETPNIDIEIQYIIKKDDKKLIFLGLNSEYTQLVDAYPLIKDKIVAIIDPKHLSYGSTLEKIKTLSL